MLIGSIVPVVPAPLATVAALAANTRDAAGSTLQGVVTQVQNALPGPAAGDALSGPVNPAPAFVPPLVPAQAADPVNPAPGSVAQTADPSGATPAPPSNAGGSSIQTRPPSSPVVVASSAAQSPESLDDPADEVRVDPLEAARRAAQATLERIRMERLINDIGAPKESPLILATDKSRANSPDAGSAGERAYRETAALSAPASGNAGATAAV